MIRKTKVFRVVAISACLSLLLAVVGLKALTWTESDGLLAVFDTESGLRNRAANLKVNRPDPLPEDVVALIPSDRPKGGAEGLLARELARQAILIAARDELGLRTRDASLRELSLDADGEALRALRPAVVSPGDGADGRMGVALHRVGERLGPYWATVPAGRGNRLTYLARELEGHSRGAFVKALESHGYRKAAAASADGGDGSDRDPRPGLCDRFDIVSQFAAARGWHAAIKSGGETAERLDGLVRAYANLGLLTAHHWSPAQKAYRARSLLYAERLLHRTGETRRSLWRRAYARALAGLPGPAEEDLIAASRLPAEGGEAPGFVAVLEAYCAGDSARVAALTDEGYRPDRILASLLQLDDAELARSQRLTERYATTLLAAEPACTRAFDALMSDQMPLGTMRRTQEKSFGAVKAWLYGPLTRSGLPVPGVTEKVETDRAAEGERRRRMTERLLDDQTFRSGDGEPSMLAFGRLVEEEGFYQAWRVIVIDRGALGVDADERIEATLPWAWHHPFRSYLESLAWDRNAGSSHRSAAIMQFGNEQPVPAYEPLHRIFEVNSPELLDEGNDWFWRNCDDTLSDLVWLTGQAGRADDRRRNVRRLERVAPNAAVTAALLCQHDGDRVSGRAAEWERRFAGDAGVMKAIGELHFEEWNTEEAIRCLGAASRLVPDYKTHSRLADIHDFLGNEDRFLACLEDALAQPSHGLEHAQANESIARHLMRAGRFREALPYAVEAADSYSGWGLICAADCYEGLGQYDAAERLMRACSERYRDSATNWYWWCLRTGRGDVAAARELAQTQLKQLAEYHRIAGQDQRRSLAFYEEAEGKPESAMTWLAARATELQDSQDWLSAALIADELGKSGPRDDMFAAAVAPGGSTPFDVAFLVATFREDLAGSPLDPEQALAGVRRTSGYWGTATESYYRLGRYLENRGRATEAQRFYRLAATSPATLTAGCTLARLALKRLGVTAGDPRLVEMDEAADRARRTYGGAEDYYGLGRYRAALVRAELALAGVPDHEAALNLRANSLVGLERFAEAAAAYEAILREAPRRNDVTIYLAKLREYSGDQAAAVVGYEAAIASDASPAEKVIAHNNLSWLRSACVDPAFRSPEEAMRHADLAAGLGAKAEDVGRTRASALAAAGRFEEAVAAAEAVRPQVYGADRYLLDDQLALYRAGRPYVRPAAWWKKAEGYADVAGAGAGRRKPPVEAPRPVSPPTRGADGGSVAS